ncbi:MAG: amino acid adenylation domain-containing protein, partial [Acidobacteriota bacterium]
MMQDLSRRIARLTPERREHLEALLRRREQPALRRRGEQDSIPLSFAQERLWFIDQMEPGQAAYNLPVFLLLQGTLHLEALQGALNHVIRRHESLRTSFPHHNGVPVQQIQPPSRCPLPVVDLQALPEESCTAELGRLAEEESRRPFDLAEGPLIRAALVLMAEQKEAGGRQKESGVRNQESGRAESGGRGSGFRVPGSGSQTPESDKPGTRNPQPETSPLQPHSLTASQPSSPSSCLLLSIHHIISDGWSMGILATELGSLYQACLQGRPPRLPELPVQYADYAFWQRESVSQQAFAQQVGYWKEYLKGLPPLLELPLDRPRPAIRSARAARLGVELPLELTARLVQLGRRDETTLFTVLLAAFQALLGRWTGQGDFAVGTPIAGRRQLETEGLIGFFVNTLVMRAELTGDPSFSEHLQRSREAVLEAHAHQDVPFEKLVAELSPQRSLGHTPLFQAALALQNAPAQPLALEGLQIQPVPLASSEAKFDLTLELSEREGGLSGEFEYNSEVFDRTTIQRLSGHWRRLIEAVAADSDRRISQIPLLEAAQRQQLLWEWNPPHPIQGHREEVSVAVRFLRQAVQTPDSMAAAYGDRQASYRELQRRSGSLAGRLREAGVGPGSLVGVLAERSLEMLTALAGILRAGAAYLPLDADYPSERLAFMLQDAQAAAVLAQGGLLERLPEESPPVLDLDEDKPAPAFDAPSNPESLAYVIYTSGSTGTPKGVAIPHGAILRLTRHNSYLELDARDRVGQVANSSFDAITFELWGALLNGGCVVGLPRETILSPALFADLLAKEGISALFLTTALFNQIAAQRPEAFRGVRHLLFGGEAADPRWVRKALGSDPPERLLHVYGPTESTTFASWHPVREVPRDAQTVPIGAALGWTSLFVVDRQLLPALPGTAGELLIGGSGLARGYLNRPGLTAERFVPHPFLPGQRLYRSGDRVRWLPGGALEFLGRFDDQVKIRGFRIEPGEVEALLATHPEVASCSVLAVEGEHGRRLVAYVVRKESGIRSQESGRGERGAEKSSQRPPRPLSASSAVSPPLLSSFLRRQLPDFMVPSTFAMLDALPLTPNGKVDRRALLKVEAAEGGGGTAAPETPVEEVLAGIWADVLQLDEVGAEDDFFERGGHSLLATRVVSRIRRAFGVELPLRTLFEAPRPAALAVRIEELRLQGRQPPPPLLRLQRPAELPLSFAQQRLWFLDRLEPGNPLYNIPAAFSLQGRLDLPALQAALDKLLRRHEALRTRFEERQGRPVQRIDPPSTFPLPQVDLQRLPESLRSGESHRLAKAEARRPFDLARDSLIRATLVLLTEEKEAGGRRQESGRAESGIRNPEPEASDLVGSLKAEETSNSVPSPSPSSCLLPPASCLLLATMHHIVSDGWSIGVLMRELTTLYESFSRRELPTANRQLPPLPIQYADYALWQRSWLRGRSLQRQLGYWVRRLQGAPALELPADRPRPKKPGLKGGRRRLRWPAKLVESLQGLSRQQDTTLYMTLLALFQSLLSRYSGQTDISVGFPIANRTRAETEGLIGCFINTLVLRTSLKGNPSFEALLGRVRQALLEAYDHQDMPFEQVVEAVQPERTLSRQPLFQVMFILQNAPSGALQAPGLEVAALENPEVTSPFDLTLSLAEQDDHLEVEATYRLDLFEASTIRRLLEHFRCLAESALAHPGQGVQQLTLLSEPERHQMLREWHSPAGVFPLRKDSVHSLFELQARQTPDAVAATLEGADGIQPPASLSYSHLDRCSNRLARLLRGKGAGAEVPVGLLMERSLEMLAALLGILKSSSYYLPLDPAYPQERVNWMMGDAAAGLLVTESRLRASVPALAQAVNLDTLEGWASPALVDRTSGSAAPSWPESTAYVIYTSGSSGLPKGVAVPHRAMSLFVRAWADEIGYRSQDRLPLFSRVSFDQSVGEIFPVLIRGGGLLLNGQAAVEAPAEYLDRIRRLQITVLDLATAYWHQVASELAPSNRHLPRSLRLVVMGGESVLPERLREWERHTGSYPKLRNAYGPTEATVGATITREYPNSGLPGGMASIGRALPGYRLFLCDARLQPAPAGVAAELLIGGAAVTRGYLGQPSQTAEKFVPDPFAQEPGARLYRTGDLVRFFPDGRLEFAGRIDRQLKIRGYRIEPGEIEAVLAVHPAVTACAVLGRDEPGGGKSLMACLASDWDPPPRPAELRSFLQEQLPEYMVPSSFLVLEELPLTASAKVDWKALLQQAPREAETALEAPRTPTEELLAGIWSSLLGVEQVGRRDSFFDLGGHSLIATQAVSRIRQVFGLELPLRTLFEAPRLADLAAHIEGVQRMGGAGALPDLEKREGGQPAPLSFGQQRLWFLDQLEPGNPLYNEPLALQLSGRLEVNLLQASLDEVVRRHEVLRTCFPSVQGQPVQKVVEEFRVTLPLVDLTALGSTLKNEAQRLLRQDAEAPFDLARGPVLRTTLLRSGPEEHLLLACMHHIASDAWSQGILVGEVGALYQAFLQGRPSPLHDLPIQYADFAFWQQRWLSGEVLRRQVDYWKENLQDAPAALELPTDHPRPEQPTFEGALCRFSWPADLRDSLLELSRRSDSTLFMTISAGFQALLHRYSGQHDICLGTPIANRGRVEIEPLIGFFLNTLVLRTRFHDRPRFSTLLERVREASLGAYAHQDVPFEQLVEILQPQRTLNRTPLLQVMFTLENAPEGQQQALPGLEITGLETSTGRSRFEMTLWMSEVDEGLSGVVEYSLELFEESTIRRLTGQLGRLLASAAADPEIPVAELPLLGGAEKQQLLVEWAAPQGWSPEAAPQSVQHRVEVVAGRQPDALAAVFAEGHLSYAGLLLRSRQVARALQLMGAQPDQPVGILLERSLETPVGLLGVLLSGGACMPLDPAYPPQRLRLMLADSAAPAIVSQTSLLNRLPLSEGKILLLDSELAPLEAAPRCPAAAGSRLAYVIYTSGSTGIPKGVAITHRTLSNLASWQLSDPTQARGLRTLQFSALSFDVSFQEVSSTLCSGATLVLLSEDQRRDPSVLLHILAREQIEALFMPFVALQQLARTWREEGGRLPALRRVMTAGEQLQMTEGVISWLDNLPGCRLHNHYGPSETHAATCFTQSGPAHEWPALPPVGRPIWDASVYLLNESLQPAPLGVSGELCIGGGILARGYLGRPSWTAQRFLPDPFSSQPGARLYRSGDLARHRRDGNIDFLGRLDQQVKILGFRIELGEIEATLDQHPRVHQAVVVERDGQLAAYVVRKESGVRNQESGRAESGIRNLEPEASETVRSWQLAVGSPEKEPGTRNLQPGTSASETYSLQPTAYSLSGKEAGRGEGGAESKVQGLGRESGALQPHSLSASQPSYSSEAYSLPHDLRQFLSGRLPAYMVPAYFTVLEAFPLTPSGKVHRKALPEPERHLAAAQGREEGIRTPTQELLAGIWCEVLELEEVSRSDSFFELG